MINETTLGKALAAIKKGRANYEYFFDNLNSPEWIQPLASKGFFGKPPEMERDGQYLKFPHWPESRYLARMAEAAPNEVITILLKIPETDNWRVSDDIAEAALKLSPELAARLIPTLRKSLDQPYPFPLPGKLAQLALRLAEAGRTRQAAGLLEAVLALSVVKEDESARSRPTVRPRVDTYQFEEILRDLGPKLTDFMGIEALKLFVGLLKRFSELSHLSTEGGDLSYVERPAIEDHEQNWHHGIIDAMVEAVRDSSAMIVEKDISQLAPVVDLLKSERVGILYRIAMFLVATFPSADREMLRNMLVNRDSFESVSMRHEYAFLSKIGFGLLESADQEIILRWIDDQDAEQLTKQLGLFNQEPTEERIRELSELHRLERLVPIKDSLPHDWRSRFDELVARRGEPEHPEFTSYHTGFVGPTSPVDVDQLTAMSPAQIAKFVRDWRPESESFDAPTPEGFARQLGETVKTRVSEFSAAAEHFLGLGPTYVRGYLNGIEQAGSEGNRPEWGPVLTLCEWVLDQDAPMERAERRGLDEDPDWRWSRQQVAGLLDSGLSSSKVRPDVGLRERVWALVEQLAGDPDPTPEHEAIYGGQNMNPPTLAINTTRGKAMHAIVRYVLWQREVGGDGFTLEAVPEAREVLDFHLLPENDPSLAVRSTYGQFAPWLAMVDEEWFLQSKERIFDSREGMSEYWRSAWDAYVVLCSPYDQMGHLLESEYRHAVDLSKSATSSSGMWDTEASLASHLLVFYARGKMALKEESPFAYLLKEAPVWVRAKGLSSLGNDIYRSDPKPQGEFVERLRILWDHLLSEERSGPTDDIETFGWWFASGVFPEDWSLDALLSALRITSDVDHVHFILERLAKLAPTQPRKTFEALRAMSETKSNRWEFAYQNEKVSQVLTEALRNGDADLKGQATDYINLLGARGFQWYRKLLAQPS